MVVLKVFNITDTKEPISILELGEHVVGRGSFANCTDGRIAERHIVINVKDNEVTLTLNHTLFFMSKDSSSVRIFNKDECIVLSDGDKFAFLTDTWYSVQIDKIQSNNGNLIGCTAAATPVSNNISSDTVAASMSKTISQPTSCKRSAEDLYSGKEKKIKVHDECSENLKDNSEQRESLVEQNITEVFEKFDSDDVDSDAEMLPEVTCDTEVVNGVQDNSDEASQLGDTNDKEDHRKSCEMLGDSKKMVSQEAELAISDVYSVQNPTVEKLLDLVKTENTSAEPPEDNENTTKDGQDTTAASTSSNRTRREHCWYGHNCYRKNPGHRDQFSHPGDSDHGSNSDDDDRPRCPYGAQCYRTNPQHRQEYKHPTSRPASRPSTNSRRNRQSNMDSPNTDYDSDEGDPFSADESSSASEVFEGADSDSDYMEEPNFDDVDDSEEVKIMFKEAKKFLRKKR